MSGVVQDLKYAARGFLKSPGFTLIVVLTLTLGIGGTVAVYSVLRAALWRPLPYPEPERLVLGQTLINGNPNPLVSFPDYLDAQDQLEAFEALGAITGFTIAVTVTGTDQPERVDVAAATGSLFKALGTRPIVGRTFTEEEAAPGGPMAMILSYGYWQRRFGGDRDVVNRTVRLNGTPVPIVGVMPESFHIFDDAEAWFVGQDGGPWTGVRRYHNWLLVGRLAQGTTLASAQAEADVLSAHLAATYPDDDLGKAFGFVDLHGWLVRNDRTTLFLLMGASALVLLIVCGNVASLLLARGSARRTEMAVRTALGAGAPRLIRQLLTECVLLALAAGALGVVAAFWLQDLILGYVQLDLLGIRDLSIDPWLLAFALIVSVGTALLFGVVPAVVAARSQPAQDLKEGMRTSAGGGARFRSGLVVFQVAASVVLLMGAALLLRSLERLRGVEPGFNAQGILAAQVALPPARYQDADARLRFFTDLTERVEAIPGVEAVGMIDRLPVRNPGNNVAIWNPATPPTSNQNANFAFQRVVIPGYFRAMGIPVVAGRDFDDTDVADGPPTIILDQTAADTVFPGENPLGRTVAVDVGDSQPGLFEVVGVVGNHHTTSSLRDRFRPCMFLPFAQRPAYTLQVAVRTAGDPTSLIGPVRDRLWSLDREIPLGDPAPLAEAMQDSMSGLRGTTTMLGLFSATALLLAALGLYGVLAFFVTQRTREIGIRMALGAVAGEVVQLVLKRGMFLVGAGLLLGIGGALGATRLLNRMLFETSATDVGTFAGVVVFFTVVATIGCLMPAWKAVRVDPVEAFRAE